jgi:hypothetical protein
MKLKALLGKAGDMVTLVTLKFLPHFLGASENLFYFIYLYPLPIVMDLESVDSIEIGAILERLPHHAYRQYIPAIHTAIVDKLSPSGLWVTSYPDGAVYHVSWAALELRWWQLKTINLESAS